ncbi:MAG: cytochrome C oxidase subunit IV family protein [Candidatus Koribacter versatilis]|uniref:Cytochrome C oxidase subunit IV family protein n=1 Tax=Candidatus Korobacter versatilis TaxID=658062 RepID=A0A932A6D0_9BACT|nr:cytochrome C oxidase subunit IV family protein [Candidatus Koribacter versatilis]
MEMTERHQHGEHAEGKATYFYVWGALIVLTVVEIYLAYNRVFPNPLHMLEVLLALSVVKSVLIIGWFMHLKGETIVMKWVLMGSLVMCLLLMFVFFVDAERILKLGTGR